MSFFHSANDRLSNVLQFVSISPSLHKIELKGSLWTTSCVFICLRDWSYWLSSRRKFIFNLTKWKFWVNFAIDVIELLNVKFLFIFSNLFFHWNGSLHSEISAISSVILVPVEPFDVNQLVRWRLKNYSENSFNFFCRNLNWATPSITRTSWTFNVFNFSHDFILCSTRYDNQTCF